MDIYKGGNNYALGYMQEGEWLEYAVIVKRDGRFYISANVASGTESSSFSLLLDDKEIVPSTKVPKTGDEWNVYERLELGQVEFTKGEHVLKLLISKTKRHVPREVP